MELEEFVHCTWFPEGGLGSDVVLVIRNHRYYAHKVLLAGFSRYFHKLFTRNDSPSELFFLEISHRALHVCLEFCYAQKAELTEEIVFDVFDAAKILQIESIQEVILQFISGLIRRENAFAIYKFAQSNGHTDLMPICFRYILEDISLIRKHLKFFPFHRFKAFTDSARNYGQISDVDLIHVFALWIFKNRVPRQEFGINLLNNYFHTKPGVQFHWEFVKPICLDEASLECLKEALESHYLYAKTTLDDDLDTENPNEVDNITIVLRKSKRGTEKILYLFWPESKTFSKITNLTQGDVTRMKRWGDRIVYHEKNQVRLYDFNSDKWTDLQKTKKHILYCFIWKDQLHVLTSPLEIYKYTFISKNWIKVGCGSNERGSAIGLSSAVLGHKLYVRGGFNYKHGMKCFNLETSKWSILPQPPTSRFFAKLVPFNGFLYVFNGHTLDQGKKSKAKSTERFDPKTSLFTLVDDWPVQKILNQFLAYNGELWMTNSKRDIIKYSAVSKQTEVLVNLKTLFKGFKPEFVTT